MNNSSEINSSTKFPSYKDHLNKTFLEELNYKFWITKGTRFKTSKKLLTKSDLSNKSMGFLSAYLIIFGLLSVYKISGNLIVSDNLIAFGSTTISILLLAFGQMEAAQDYKVTAKLYQECALKISALYDELRIYKTVNKGKVEESVFCKELSGKYQNILDQYPNHDDIDYKSFQADHKDYFHLKPWRTFKIRFHYYRQVKLIYHLLIFAPPTIFLFFVLK